MAFFGLSLSALAAKDAVDYVDPFIGTGHNGKDFPGATVPFSMVKLSPDEGGNISYRYGAKFIQGFSFTHLGGADGGELGNVLVTPTTGPLSTSGGGGKPGLRYGSNFSKSTEQATAGYYAVTLDEYQTRAEMTVAPHSGILRFTFPENAQSRIQIDLSHRNGGTSLHQTCKVIGDHTIEGQIDCTPAGGRLARYLHRLLPSRVQQALRQVRHVERHATAGLDGTRFQNEPHDQHRQQGFRPMRAKPRR